MDKTVLNFSDLAKYTGLSKSYLYRLSSEGKLPAYKPLGKCLFFDRVEVDAWLRQNPITQAAALETSASTLVTLQTHTTGGGDK